ncbi:MFS transporter [Brevibacterium renqingii]|uniref:MFS transporter n=1 Tax=Brevibacterium renqingii TaxID=2776916 RepID=UPI001AE0987D|nr:MFS transporter [Brevibacterium renqingii]
MRSASAGSGKRRGAVSRGGGLWTAKRAPFISSALTLMALIAFESFAVTTVLPVAMADLDGRTWYSAAYAGTITTGLVGYVLAGTWIDAHGVRKPLALGGTLFVLGIAACAVATDPQMFVFGRLVQGLGGGIDSVVIYVLIARVLPEDLRPRMFGLLSAAWLVPSLAGPLAAGYLTEATSWRVVFWFVVVGSAAAIIALFTSTAVSPTAGVDAPSIDTAESGPAQSGASSQRGHRRILSAAVAAAALLALHSASQLPLGASVAALVLASVILVGAARAILPAGTLRLRGPASRLIGLRGALGATVTACDVHLTLFLQSHNGHSATTAGLVVASGAGGWAVGSWAQGRFDSRGATDGLLLAAGAPLVACGPLAVLGHVTELLPLAGVVIGCVLMGLGMGIVYPRIASATLRITDPRRHGEFSSSLQVSESMITTTLLAVVGIVLSSSASSSGFVISYLVMSGLALVGVAVAWSYRLSA